MLVLNRKKEEQIVINDNIIIRVIECGSDHVKLGIEAPKDVSVHRYEVFKAIEAENRFAVTTDVSDFNQLPTISKNLKKPNTP